MSVNFYNLINSFQTLLIVWGIAIALDLLP
jgi:hypothetical protein